MLLCDDCTCVWGLRRAMCARGGLVELYYRAICIWMCPVSSSSIVDRAT